MENSNNYSSMNKAVAGSKETAVSPAEESGWTSYFEDLSDHEEEEEDHSLCSSFDNSSMTNHVVACSSIRALPEKLTFKKTRAREIFLDDSLEDTASSPGNSPKVSDLRQIDMNPRKNTDDRYFNSSLGKIEGCGLEQHAEGVETSERCEMNFSAVKNDRIDLKKRGLCLVPFSMVFNYLG
ncbi:actin-related protein [Salix suchowensis]|nr:actin-related protein [Salix suchowensis]